MGMELVDCPCIRVDTGFFFSNQVEKVDRYCTEQQPTCAGRC